MRTRLGAGEVKTTLAPKRQCNQSAKSFAREASHGPSNGSFTDLS
jgi:hypothetical protein